MDIALLSDTVSLATSQTLGLAKLILRQPYLLSAAILPMDALAPPPVKSSSPRTARRTLLRKKRRTKRRSFSGGDDSEDSGEGDGFFGGGNDDGIFGGGGYGGRGWNFDGFGDQNWDESSRWSSNDFAFDFVYEVIYWIALSNCVHFAFKKVLRSVADGERQASH
ncbi:uncharacterized protein LOC116135576 [Pistacia vera]|uniref:Uncharacterized protein n=1 Tax=Pistacia atlantica TaxID=434234 RepID=A0ACC1B3K9_9ROSI|nr:uncharacterized protein LOC116135576 [Pistacia vera]KAJ0093521.1 hypothetical protein Patl1_24988 [Pistacia atlantica]